MQARITQIKKVMFLEDDWEKKTLFWGISGAGLFHSATFQLARRTRT
jgi:hypothetical protein